MSDDQELSSRLHQVEQAMLSGVAKLEGDYDRNLITEELAEVLCFLARYKVRLLEIEGHSYPYASLGNLLLDPYLGQGLCQNFPQVRMHRAAV